MNESEEDLDERRRAEIEFVSAAYEPSEAWCEGDDGVEDSSWIVHRRLKLQATKGGSCSEKDTESASLLLHMFMPVRYPAQAALEISGHVEDDRCTTSRLVKTSHDALPSLLEACREMGTSLIGEEAIFGVLSRADEWIQEDWPRYLSMATTASAANATKAQSTLEAVTPRSPGPAVLRRILIYSHHIISKKKRADMKQLANKYKLTGYIKTGWPGLMILEGLNGACHEFYDEIRRWNWKYLVVRGEMQETAAVSDISSDEGGGHDVLDRLNSMRRFEKFVEVDDMSVVATACREADLEDLFRTSMKVYKDSSETMPDSLASEEVKPYGVLAHVDHMNDAKGYAKWLRKNCSELDVCLAIKQLQEESSDATTSDNSCAGRWTNIIVCLVGEKADMSSLLKRWRTSRVDVDARGKPCLERMMTVLIEGFLERAPSSGIDWEQQQQPFQVNNDATSSNQQDCNTTSDLVRAIGGQIWVDSLQTLLHSTASR